MRGPTSSRTERKKLPLDHRVHAEIPANEKTKTPHAVSLPAEDWSNQLTLLFSVCTLPWGLIWNKLCVPESWRVLWACTHSTCTHAAYTHAQREWMASLTLQSLAKQHQWLQTSPSYKHHISKPHTTQMWQLLLPVFPSTPSFLFGAMLTLSEWDSNETGTQG